MSQSFAGSEAASSRRWALPLAIGAIGVLYQIIVGGALDDGDSGRLEHVVDLILFGVINPALAFWGWTVIARAKRAEHMLTAINMASPDAFIRLGADGRIEFWSRQAEILLGYSARLANGRTLGELFGPQGEPAWLRLQYMVRRSGFVRGQEAVFHTCSGTEIPVQLSASTVRGDLERPPGLLVVLRNTSRPGERTPMIGAPDQRPTGNVKQVAGADTKHKRAEGMQIELLSIASHEIRGPLGNIRAATERMLAECDELSPCCQRLFGLIDGQLGHADELVRSVLCAANIETGKLVLHKEPMSVMAAMQEVAQAMKTLRDSRPVRLSAAPDLPPVDADREHVVAVLRNLVGNADKYTPPGAEIMVTAEASVGCVTLRVRDSGPGLPPDNLERIFDKCYRGPEARGVEGYGLGLYICRQVVVAHGGRIWAENDPRGGAVFSFTLPTAR